MIDHTQYPYVSWRGYFVEENDDCEKCRKNDYEIRVSGPGGNFTIAEVDEKEIADTICQLLNNKMKADRLEDRV